MVAHPCGVVLTAPLRRAPETQQWSRQKHALPNLNRKSTVGALIAARSANRKHVFETMQKDAMRSAANRDLEHECQPPAFPALLKRRQTCAEVLRGSWPPSTFRSAPEPTLLTAWFLAQRESTAHASGIKFESVLVLLRDTIVRRIALLITIVNTLSKGKRRTVLQ